MSRIPVCASVVFLLLWLLGPIGELAAQNQPKKTAPAKAPATNAPAAKGTLLSDVKNSGTPMIGYVGFDRKIPWMKPEDIEVTDNLPRIGEKGSFGILPWKSPLGMAAPFVVGNDGAVLISQKIDTAMLRAFLTVNAAKPVASKIPSVPIAAMEANNIAKGIQSVLHFVQAEGKLHVRLVKGPPN